MTPLFYLVIIVSTSAENEPDTGRNVTTDGKYLYCTNYSGRGLVKIGTGLHGTLRSESRIIVC